MTELSEYVSLSERVSIYVPSTTNINQHASSAATVKEVASRLSELFGGATSCDASGFWVSKKVGLVMEQIVIVYANCNKESLTNNINKVIAICENIKKSMNQECVSLEINNTLYFI